MGAVLDWEEEGNADASCRGDGPSSMGLWVGGSENVVGALER